LFLGAVTGHLVGRKAMPTTPDVQSATCSNVASVRSLRKLDRTRYPFDASALLRGGTGRLATRTVRITRFRQEKQQLVEQDRHFGLLLKEELRLA